MTNPLPPDKRPWGTGFRSFEVMKVPIQYLLPYSADDPNPHDTLTEDTPCSTCSAGGNVKNVDPNNLGEGPTNEAPEVGRSYLWDIPTLPRNHRCPLCRLVWKTFQPFYEKLEGSAAPSAVLGYNRGREEGVPRWIELLPMTYRNTIDNRDMQGSGQVYIYEDERIPHFNITKLATNETSTTGKVVQEEWRQSKVLENDKIDFDLMKKWLMLCETDHGSKCSAHEKAKVPAKRLIDVERSCIVDGSVASRYMALSYVWGMAAQFMLTKDVVDKSGTMGFLDSLGSKIPRCIRDAMEVCRKIDVRYLWVDALCIVQDDIEAKAREIDLMDEVYGCALAILVVAAGEDADYGIPGTGACKRELVSYVEVVDGEELTTSLATTTLSAKRSKWNSRAWTYQEYILGNRLLVFTETYVFFRCSTAMFRDDAVVSASGYPLPVPADSDDAWISYSINDIPEETPPRKVWKDYYDNLLTIYLRRSMKYDSDALPAFTGVLKVLSKSLGAFHFGLPKKYFGLSLLWNAPHREIFTRRSDFPSWSWAGWKWSFEYFGSERSTQGAYGYEMPKETVPMQFFIFNADGKLEPFFREESEATGQDVERARPHRLEADDLMAQMMYWNSQLTANPDATSEELDAIEQKLLAEMMVGMRTGKADRSAAEEEQKQAMTSLLPQFDPPESILELQFSDRISRHHHVDHLIAFYTSVASLKVTYSEDQNVTPNMAVQYDVTSDNGGHLFHCYIDPAWRDKQPDRLEFIVIGLKPGEKSVALLLVENIGGIYYRVNWDWKLTQHLGADKWMSQGAVQKLIILG